ncbi:MAG TPA: hypothetical protein VI837_14305 [Blastocatellia bacterium]|nr:hypothetical protein [Blastocatellia bacterium]
MKTKTKVEAKRTVFTYAYLNMAANQALEHAEASERGRTYDCMSVILFCAFTLEAYFNHLGKEKFQCWELIERRLGPKEKLLLLLDVIKHSIDESRRPFQTLKDIFRLRDALAHGKTEEFAYSGILMLSADERPSEPEVVWLSYCTLANAKRCLEDTTHMITELHRRAGFSGGAFSGLEIGETSVSVLLNQDAAVSDESHI